MNNGEIAYNDIHLSQMAQEVRYGFMGKVNVAIIEACEVTPDGKIYLTAAGGIAPTVCRLADQIIVELNAAHSKNAMGLHDVYEPLDPPYRREIPIYKPSDRIGLPYIQVDPKKIVGVVETNWPDEARSFAAADPLTDKIGQNVADFLAADMNAESFRLPSCRCNPVWATLPMPYWVLWDVTRPSRRLKCTQKSSRTPLSDLSAKAA